MLGSPRRTARITAEDGRSLIVAFDHGIGGANYAGMASPGRTLDDVISAGADAVLTTIGMAEAFGRWLVNSLFLASAQTAIVVTLASLGGFALAKYEFRGKKPLMALMLATIGGTEPAARTAGTGSGFAAFWRSIGQGLRFMVENRVLLALSAAAGLFNLFDGMIFAVYILYASRELAIPPALLGVIIAAGGVGGLLGAFVAGWVSRRLTAGRALLAALVVATVGEALIAFASGPLGLTASLLLAAEVLVGLGAAVFSINYLTLRQLLTPVELQGRVHATNRTIITGLVPVGALVGGVLGQLLGLRAPLIVGAAGTLLAAVLLFASPLRTWRAPGQP